MTHVIHCSDVIVGLKKMESESCDGLISDPPCGIGFMNEEWDKDKGGRDKWIAWLQEVMCEALRVLKPGARGWIWALPRTSHWTATALENAGFEITDRFTHVFGSGYPKSLNMERVVSCATCLLPGRHFPGRLPKPKKFRAGDHKCPMTPEGKRWIGYGSALKPGGEDWFLVQKPMTETYAKTALQYGTSSLDIAGCRLGAEGKGEQTCRFQPGECEGHESKGRLGLTYHSRALPVLEDDEDDTDSRDEYSVSDFAMTPGKPAGPQGRWPSNFGMSHTDFCRVVGKRIVGGHRGYPNGPGGSSSQLSQKGTPTDREEPWDGIPDQEEDEYECSEDCPVLILDRQSGNRKGMSGGGVHKVGYAGGMFGSIDSGHLARNDSGGASRFFFVAKPSRAEREFGCYHLPLKSPGDTTGREDDSDGLKSPRAGAGRTSGAHNFHSTVKALKLAEHLARAILPPPHEDGSPRKICVPFLGSGTELIGALRVGWEHAEGIEGNAEYIPILKARVEKWLSCPLDMSVEEILSNQVKTDPRQTSLF